MSPCPLVQAAAEAAGRRPAVFHTPGHKRGRWVPSELLPAAGIPWSWDGGDAVWDPERGHDLSEAAEEAARLAAKAWGSRRTWFLWNGATAGVLAMVLAGVPSGGRLLLPRCVHRSVVDALVLADAEPLFLPPRWLDGWDIVLPPAAEDVLSAVGARAGEAASAEGLAGGAASVGQGATGPGRAAPSFDAALVISPTYEGICADLAAIASAVRPAPLLVDEAHGAHLAFYPPPAPPTGLRSGAQLVVHGAHKTLPVLTQTGLLHWTGAVDFPDADRVGRLLSALQSTSPQPALLVSLDAARWEMERDGARRVEHAVELARRARAAIESAGPYRCLDPHDLPPPFALDETRLVVDIASLGVSGWDARRALVERHGVWPEMAGSGHLVFIITGADDESGVRTLVSALAALAREARSATGFDGAASCPRPTDSSVARTSRRMPAPGRLVMRPRQAALGPARRVPWAQAPGHVAAATVTPYPPGTPLVIPGEMITDETAAYALELGARGAILRGCPGSGGEVWVVDA